MTDEKMPEEGTKLSANEEMAALELDQARIGNATALEAQRKEKATADKAEAEVAEAATEATPAKSPASAIEAPEGKIEVGEGVGLVADLVAHSLVGDAAKQIAGGLKRLTPRDRVLIVESADLIRSDWPYMAISNQIEIELRGLEQVEADLRSPAERRVTALKEGEDGKDDKGPRAAVAPLAVIAAGLGVVSDVASLFRADYQLKSRAVTIGSPSLLGAIAKELLEQRQCEVDVDGLALLERSRVFKRFAAAQKVRLQVEALCTELEQTTVADADRLISRAKEARAAYVKARTEEGATPDGVAALKCEMEILEGNVDEAGQARAKAAVARAALKRFDQLAAAITKAPKDGYPPLVAAAIRERLHEDRSDKSKRYTHVLVPAVESSGGEVLTRRGFFHSTARFMGGAQVSYLLWDVESETLLAADTISVLGELKTDLSCGTEGRVHEIDLARR